MKSPIYTSVTLLILSFLTSCSGFQAEVEIPNTFEFQEQVFISGLFTNEVGFASVDIQKSIPADSTGFNPVNDAQVVLYSREAANSTAVLVADSFTVSNGRYTSTSTEEITSTVGHTYWVDILLQDGTTFISEEEVLKSSLPLIKTLNENGTTGISFLDPINEDNFYLSHFEYFKDDTLSSDSWGLFNDLNEDSDMPFTIYTIGNLTDGGTVKVSLYNINFNTFQFYNNSLVQLDNDFDIFFSPLRNLYGNVTNTTTNKIALGNFGIAGFSTITMDF